MSEESENGRCKAFMVYDDTYSISPDGTILNYKTGHAINHSLVASGHHRVDIHGKHMLVHRLVYQMFGDIWPLPKGYQVNHRDDDKSNNHISNLYAGTQKENIADCIRNGTRKGHLKELVVRRKEDQKVFRFAMAKDFFEFDGHPAPSNGGVGRSISRDWFKDKYELVSFGKSKSKV